MPTSFKVRYHGIGLCSDGELAEETFSVMLEKDTIISGSFVNDKVVQFDVDGDSVFCSIINLEETEGKKEIERKREEIEVLGRK